MNENDSNPTINEAARALSRLGASKGGKARRDSLTPEERSEIARRAGATRWAKEAASKPPSAVDRLRRATHEGELDLGGTIVHAAVLGDKTRVLSQRQFSKALGSPRGGRAQHSRLEIGGAVLPIFLAYENLRPFLDKDLVAALEVIEYLPKRGGRSAFGQNARIVPQVCDVWLRARETGALRGHQLVIAANAERIMRGLAHVGIVALVDAATGYESESRLEELEQILKAYVSPEFLPWTRRFPDDFYKEMFRLRKWQFDSKNPRRGPRYAGKLTNEIVFEKLPEGILQKMRDMNPATDSGQRKKRHHSLLTLEIGVPHLEKHLAVVTALMRAATNWPSFERLLARALPSPTDGQQGELFDLDGEDE